MIGTKEIKSSDNFEYKYSVCTLVTDHSEYAEMIRSFVKGDFGTNSTEYLYIDNSERNTMDAYSGLNEFLLQSRGEYVILCHQDILLQFDRRDKLESCIKQLNDNDPAWALCGNAGAVSPNHIVYRISYPNGLSQSKGRFPVKVASLDENFIVVKKKAGISLSTDLEGFHLYGTDICLQAKMKGYNAYVIDFNLLHKSRGNPDESFSICKNNLIKKYNKSFRPRWIQTTSTTFYLSGTMLGKLVGNPVFLFFIRMWNGLMKRINR